MSSEANNYGVNHHNINEAKVEVLKFLKTLQLIHGATNMDEKALHKILESYYVEALQKQVEQMLVGRDPMAIKSLMIAALELSKVPEITNTPKPASKVRTQKANKESKQ